MAYCNTKIVSIDDKTGFTYEETPQEYKERIENENKKSTISNLQNKIDEIEQDTERQKDFTITLDNINNMFSNVIFKNRKIKEFMGDNYDLKETINTFQKIGEQATQQLINKAKYLFASIKTYTEIGKYYESRINEVLKLVKEGKVTIDEAFEEMSDLRSFYRNIHTLAESLEKELIDVGLESSEPIFQEFKNIQTYWKVMSNKVIAFNLDYFTASTAEDFDQEDVDEAFQSFLDSYENQKQEAIAKGRNKDAASYQKKIEDLKLIKPTKENIKEILKGNRRDMNHMDFLFNAMIRSSDAVVSAFRLKLNNIVARVKIDTLKKTSEMTRAFQEFMKNSGRTRFNNEKQNEGIYEKVLFHKYDDDTKEITSNMQVWLNSRYNNSAVSLAVAEWRKEIAELEDKPLEKRLKQHEYGKWRIQNFQQKYKDKVYDIEGLLSDEALKLLDEVNTNVQTQEILLATEYSFEQEELYQEALFEQKNLRRERDRNGKMKPEDDLKIAQEIDAFFKERALLFKELTDDEKDEATLIAQEKHDRDFVKLESNLAEMKRNGESQSKIDSTLKFWKKRNERRVVAKEYFEKRSEIYNRLSEIEKEFFDPGEKETIKEIWKKITDTVQKYRDENRQIQGEFIPKGETENIRTWLEEIDSIRLSEKTESGMSIQDKKQFTDLLDKYNIPKFNKQVDKFYNSYLDKAIETISNSGDKFDTEFVKYYKQETRRIKIEKENARLYLTEEENKYYKKLKDERNNLYQELDALQEKEVTTNYETEYQKRFTNYIIEEREKIGETSLLTDEVKAYYLSGFKQTDWYKLNHRTTIKYSKILGEYLSVEEPIYVWQEILPKDKTMIKTLPAYHYYKKEYKDEYINEDYETNPFNENEPLPRIGGVFDKKDVFFSEENKDKPVQKALRFLTEFYKESQKDIEPHLKPKYRLPSFEKHMMDRVIEGQWTIEKFLNGLKRKFSSTELDTDDEGIGLKEEDMSRMMTTVPLLHTGEIDINNFDYDIWGGIQKFAHAASLRKEFLPALGYSKALLETVQSGEDKVDFKTPNKSFWNILNTAKGLANKKHIRADAIIETIRTVLGNEYKKAEKIGNVDFQKIVGGFNWIAGVNTLTWNIHSSMTNLLSGRMQILIETMANRLINYKDYLIGQKEYAKLMNVYIADGMKLDMGAVSPESKMLLAWDVIQGNFEETLGQGFGKNPVKHFVGSGFWGSYLRHATEHQQQVTLWLSKMIKDKVKVNGEVMSVHNLYTMLAKKHGIYQMEDLYSNPALAAKYEITKLKDGSKWTQKDQDKLRNNIAGVNADLFGEYAKINKSVFEKSALGTATYFFRRHMVRMVAHRFAGASLPRYNITTNRLSEGFHITAWNQFIFPLARFRFDIVGRTIKEAISGNKQLSKEEVQNLRRMFAELSAILILGMLVMAVGDDGDDLKEHSFLTLYMLYFMKKVKSETEQFIPIPGMGWNEIVTLSKSPSIAFNQLANYRRIFTDMEYIMTGDKKANMGSDNGFWEKGDSKLLRDALSLGGYKGNLWHPETLIKSFDYAQRAR